MNDFVDWLMQTVNSSGFRLLSFVLTLTSLGISAWIFHRTRAVLNAQERSILSNQVQYVNEQWQDINRFMLNDENNLKLAVDVFGYSSTEEARKVY